jgi:hypothetical protein
MQGYGVDLSMVVQTFLMETTAYLAVPGRIVPSTGAELDADGVTDGAGRRIDHRRRSDAFTVCPFKDHFIRSGWAQIPSRGGPRLRTLSHPMRRMVLKVSVSDVVSRLAPEAKKTVHQ